MTPPARLRARAAMPMGVMQRSGATVLVATHPKGERAVLLHWAISAGYWALPLGTEGSLPSLPTHAAALVFDESWACHVPAAIREARMRGIAPILVFGPEPGWTADEIVATECADFVRRPLRTRRRVRADPTSAESAQAHRRLSRRPSPRTL